MKKKKEEVKEENRKRESYKKEKEFKKCATKHKQKQWSQHTHTKHLFPTVLKQHKMANIPGSWMAEQLNSEDLQD